MKRTQTSFIMKGTICYSNNKDELFTLKQGYVVCVEGICKGVFETIPEKYSSLNVIFHENELIIPGLIDLHVHAPQNNFRGLGMDLELLDWLETRTFKEEAKFSSIQYADKSYDIFVDDLIKSPNTRSCIFATIHKDSTELLMEKLENKGLITMVGKVNMDRNSPDILIEKDCFESAKITEQWILDCIQKHKNTYPILTPRFIPSCTDELMELLATLQKKYNLAVQSHLSENPSEIEWVKSLAPNSKSYADAYNRFGLFGDKVKTIMAHCVWNTEEELSLMKANKVFIAHCPQSNINLSSGIAPASYFLENDFKIGLGSDLAAGNDISIFSAMKNAIGASKLRWRLLDQNIKPLTVEQVFYMGTVGGGEFFGKLGKFEDDYEFDAVVLQDTNLKTTLELTPKERLERLIYLSDDRNICSKYVRGVKVL